MSRRLTIPVIFSLLSSFVLVVVVIVFSPKSARADSGFDSYYRYRTSQAAHWRAAMLRH